MIQRIPPWSSVCVDGVVDERDVLRWFTQYTGMKMNHVNGIGRVKCEELLSSQQIPGHVSLQFLILSFILKLRNVTLKSQQPI